MIYVPAQEIEELIFNEIKKLSINRHFLEEIIRETNKSSVVKVETLKKQRRRLEEQKREAERRRDNYSRMIGNGAFFNLGDEEQKVMLNGMKDAIQEIKEIENAISQVDWQIAEEDNRVYSAEIMHDTVSRFSELFERANQQEKKDLIKLIVHKVIFNPEEVKYSLYETPERTKLLDTAIGEEFRCNVACDSP